MAIDGLYIAGITQAMTVSSTGDREAPKDTARPVFEPRKYLGTSSKGKYTFDLNEDLNKILEPKDKDFVYDVTTSDLALFSMQDIMGHIRKSKVADGSLPTKDFKTVCACVLNNANSTPQQKLKAALMLGEYYAHYKNGADAKKIYNAISTGDLKGLDGMQVVDDRRTPEIPVSLSEKLAGVDVNSKENAPYSLQATARYYDIVNRTGEDKAKLTVAIEAVTAKIKSTPVTRANEYLFEEVYSVLAKLYLASGEKQKAVDIANMLLGKTETNPITGKPEDKVKANIPYFVKSAEFILFKAGKTHNPQAFINNPDGDSYQSAYARFQLAEDFMKAGATTTEADTKNKEAAKAYYLSVLTDPITDSHMRGHAAVNYGTVLLSLKNTEKSAEVFKAILGMPSTATNVPKSSDPDVVAQAKIGLAEANITLARTEDEKAARRTEAAKVMEEVLAYNNTGKAEADKLSDFTFERASLNLANIYAASNAPSDKEKALAMYNELLGAIVSGHTYNILRAKLGKAQTLGNLDLNTEEAKTLFGEVLAANTSDEAMQASAALGLAELLVREPANAAQAEAMFTSVINGNSDDAYTKDRARLGLQRAVLAQPEKCNLDTKAKAVEEFRGIAGRWSTDRLGQTALLETASVLSENTETRDEAAKIYSSLSSSKEKDIVPRAKLERAMIETTSKNKEEAAQAAAYLTNAADSSELPLFFRQKATLALGNYYAKNKETEKALECFNSVISSASDLFLKASALIGRGNIGAKAADKRQAFADFAGALSLIEGNDGTVPSGFRLLEIQANKGLTNIADTDPDIADGVDTMSHKEIIELYKNALEAGEMKEDPYMESEILLADIDERLNNWDHKKGHDRATSGRILNDYQAIINGDYDDMIKNTARVHLSRALQTMGQPEEAKKVLAHTLSADISADQITEIDMAEVMNNYGFIALGDSDFNLGYEYFRKASEFDQDSPNSIIYRARAAFLTEKFTKEHFTDLYNTALDKVGGTGRPSIEEMAQAALSEDKTALNDIASTPEGRFMVLTALEAQAKILYAKGNSLKSAQCFEQAKELFEMWKGAGAELPSDYLFEYQLHYDLATVYLSLNRFKDAYDEYKLIAGMPGVPNWFVKDQLNVLAPEKITLEASDNGNIDLAYRRYFERGSFGIRITENGASADTYLLLGKDKSHAVKVRFGAFNHGVIDAGIGYSKDFGRIKLSTGVDYNRNANGNEVIGINAAAEFKVSRYLTLGLDGKYEWHREDVNYGTYEIGASARYVRRIGKDLTFSASGRVAYGTQRDYSVPGTVSNNVWLNQFQASTTGETDWDWDTDTSCYTRNSGSDDKFRQRYWINYNVYDLAGKPMSAWHIAAAIEPDTRTVKVATPVYGQLNAETIDVPLNDLFIQGFAHMEGSSVVFNDSRNAVLTSPGEKPSSQEINAIDVNTLTGDATKPRVLTHKESHSVRNSTTEYRSTTTITVKGQNRITPEKQYPRETDPWGPEEELYTLEVVTTKDPMTGLTQKTVSMTGQNGTSKLLYQGGDTQLMNRKVKAAIEEYYKLDLYAGITKKFHGGILPDATEVTFAVTASAKYIRGEDRRNQDNSITPAKDQYDLTMGPRLDVRVPAGNGSFNLGAGYIYGGTKKTEKNQNGFIERKWTSGSGWNPEAYVGYTANLSGNDIENGTYVNASASTNVGPYVGISRGPVNVGIGLDGPQVGVNVHLKIGNTQVLGNLPISVSATGVNIGWIPIGAELNPVSLAVNTLGKSITDSNALEAIEKEKERLRKEMTDAQNTGDTKTAALLRFILDNLEIKEGDHQANWLKESTRIPIFNLLTSLTGTRARKVAGSIIQETREITGQFAWLGEIGVFEAAAAGSLSPETREAIKQYIEKESEPHEKKGAIAKVADAQDKVVRGALTPFRLIGKALHLTAEKPEEGCVSEPSFKAATRKKSVRRQIVEELARGGFIDPETGKVDERVTKLSGSSELGLSEDLKDKEEIIYNILVTAFKEAKIGTTQAPAAPETDEELIKAFDKKLHEDSMYLVYRTIAERGSTHETRREIGAILATLPQNVRGNIEAFIDNLPADIRFRSDKTVKVAVESEAGKDKKVKVTPEIYTKSVMQGESYSGKLAIEQAAVEEFKHGNPTVEGAFENLVTALKTAADTSADLDNDRINDEVYRAALVLFMLAADDDENAVAVQEKLETIDKIDKDYRNILLLLKEDISDFILNRRPGSTKIFGGQRDAIKVVNNSLSVKDRKFTVREYVELAIAGKLDNEIDARVRAEKLEEEMKKMQSSRKKSGETTRTEQRIPGIPASGPLKSEEAAPANIDANEAKLLSRSIEEEKPDRPAKVELTDKETEKAAKAERIRKAQERYGVGSYRSRQR